MITFSIIAVLAVACTDDFPKINTNKNEPETVTNNLLLSTVISRTLDSYVGTGWNNGNLVAQLAAQINFTGFDRYNWSSESGQWNNLYGNLTELEMILANAKAKKPPIQATKPSP